MSEDYLCLTEIKPVNQVEIDEVKSRREETANTDSCKPEALDLRLRGSSGLVTECVEKKTQWAGVVVTVTSMEATMRDNVRLKAVWRLVVCCTDRSTKVRGHHHAAFEPHTLRSITASGRGLW